MILKVCGLWIMTLKGKEAMLAYVKFQSRDLRGDKNYKKRLGTGQSPDQGLHPKLPEQEPAVERAPVNFPWSHGPTVFMTFAQYLLFPSIRLFSCFLTFLVVGSIHLGGGSVQDVAPSPTVCDWTLKNWSLTRVV
jgi:hypothetical protein